MAIDRVTTGAVLDGTIATADIANLAVDDTKLKDGAVTAAKMAAGAAFITGMIMPYAGAIANQAGAPSGWLLCDGSQQSASTYAALKALLLTTYGAYTNGSGGSGTSHFIIPDLRGRVIAALDNMGGGSADRVTSTQGDNLGQVLGAQEHILTPAQTALVGHTHTNSATFKQSNGGSGGVNGLSLAAINGASFGNINGYIDVSITAVSGANASAAHPLLQPTMFMNYIIKT